MQEVKIGNRLISQNHKPYFIADIAANHEGSLDRAFKLIELAREAGADAAKFQNFKADKIVSKKGFDNFEAKLSHQSSWNKSVYQVYEEASIPLDWTSKLKKKCDEQEIEYMTSPYDFESIDQVNDFVNCYKIGSGDITWIEIIQYMARKGKPLILATGASTIEDVERAMSAIKKYNNPVVLMQCNTNYTAKIENFKYINLNVLKLYKNLYPETVLGLSDHTLGNITVLGAITLGARVIEKHFTDDNSRQGPDHKFSMTPKLWKDMVRDSNFLFSSLGDGIKKVEDNEKETIIVQRRALYYEEDFPKGHLLVKENFSYLRPIKEENIPPYMISDFIGKKLSRSVIANAAVSNGDIE